jgi:hypothetical protein
MNNYTTVTLVPFIQWGEIGNSNYQGGNTYVGASVPAANYYGGQGSLQTILFNVDNFVGNISIQATLTDLPDSAPWFEVTNLTATSPVDSITSNSVVGNFSWLRAVVTDFTAGNINIVTASY